jgi:hypothetical protein
MFIFSKNISFTKYFSSKISISENKDKKQEKKIRKEKR